MYKEKNRFQKEMDKYIKKKRIEENNKIREEMLSEIKVKHEKQIKEKIDCLKNQLEKLI